MTALVVMASEHEYRMMALVFAIIAYPVIRSYFGGGRRR